MRDLYQVLRQKELDMERIRKEIEILRSVIPLLSDDLEAGDNGRPSLVSGAPQSRRTSSGN